MGLIYLGTSGGLLGYLAYVIAVRSNAPPFTYEPLEKLLMHLTMLFGGVVIFVLLGLGLYYIIKSASHSQS
jgi:glycopeptide antibiotics resistance protein